MSFTTMHRHAQFRLQLAAAPNDSAMFLSHTNCALGRRLSWIHNGHDGVTFATAQQCSIAARHIGWIGIGRPKLTCLTSCMTDLLESSCKRGPEREILITFFPAILGLIRCVEDPCQALINTRLHAYHVILPHEYNHSICLCSLK